MNKTLITLAVIVLILYCYYQYQKKPQAKEDPWILSSSSFNERQLNPISEKDWKTQYLNLELENESLKDQLQNLQASQSDTEDLTLELDQAIRSRNEAQAEALALNNTLRSKNQALAKKEKAWARTKQELEEKEVNYQSRIKKLKEQIKKLESPPKEPKNE